MKLNVLQGVALVAATVLLSACGGSGSSSTSSTGGGTAASGLSVSGVAATGAALANSAVRVKCATGEGSAQTDANGQYSASVVGGVLPCMIEVKGLVDGTEITLHSVAEAGTTTNGRTAAVANVTPLTEMVVAKLTNAMPADVFAAFSAQTNIQSPQVTQATAAVLAALKDSAGIDLGAIDPFKSVLVPATASAPDRGNAHDKLLDQLKAKVPHQALALVVNQIANASAASGAAAGEGQPTLADVMSGVAAGTLANCPSALSGKYRMIDYFGRARVRQLDFKNAAFRDAEGVKLYDIVPHPSEACRFSAAGTAADGVQVSVDVVFGPAGVGTYRLQNISNNTTTVGYIFPLQARRLAELVGEWSLLQSGYMPAEGGGDGHLLHLLSKATFDAAGKLTICDHAFEQNTCVDEVSLTTAAEANGSFEIVDGDWSIPLYAYRAPNGAMTVFGTTNPTGAGPSDPTVEAMHFVATKLVKAPLPAVGAESRFWSVRQARVLENDQPKNTATGPTADSFTVQAVDAATSQVTRRRSNNAEDTITFNKPIDGLRLVSATPGGTATMAQMVLTGLGMTVSVNNEPATGPNFSGHLYAISVQRP